MAQELSQPRSMVSYMMTSTLVTSVVSAVVASIATATLTNCREIWRSFRRTRRRFTGCVARWWTRNDGYIPRSSRSRDYRDAPWWNTGPYWLSSQPPGWRPDGPGPRDWIGRPAQPERVGIVPFSITTLWDDPDRADVSD